MCGGLDLPYKWAAGPASKEDVAGSRDTSGASLPTFSAGLEFLGAGRVSPPEKVQPAAGTLCKLILTPSGRPCHRTYSGSHLAAPCFHTQLDPQDPGTRRFNWRLKQTSVLTRIDWVKFRNCKFHNSIPLKQNQQFPWGFTPHLCICCLTSPSSFPSHTAFYLRVRPGNGLIMFLGVPASCLRRRWVSISAQSGWEGSALPAPVRRWVFTASAVPPAGRAVSFRQLPKSNNLK